MPLPYRSIRAHEPALDLNRRWSFILSTSHYCKPRPTLFINPVLRLVFETAGHAYSHHNEIQNRFL